MVGAAGDTTPDIDGPEAVRVSLPITLSQFLKVASLVGSGGEAKQFISTGLVRVNGEVDTRRGRKLFNGDIVALEDEKREVSAAAEVHGSGPTEGSGGACGSG